MSSQLIENENGDLPHDPEVSPFSLSKIKRENTPHILIVENNEAYARFLRKMLGRFDCSYEHASSGEEAVEMATSKKYSLILMDIGLGGMSGLDAAKKIRDCSNRLYAVVPIVGLTAYFDSKQKCLDVGMQDMIMKPYLEKSLIDLIGKYISSIKK